MQHLAYRAPEVYLGYPCDTSLDIWAFACVVSKRVWKINRHSFRRFELIAYHPTALRLSGWSLGSMLSTGVSAVASETYSSEAWPTCSNGRFRWKCERRVSTGTSIWMKTVSASTASIDRRRGAYLSIGPGNFLHYRVGSQERNLRDEMVLNLGTLPEFPAEEVEGWHKFLLRCFQFHPEARPTAAELLQDPWLTED
jgi:serine/threonine protein kinase